jgi:hypothetical protein
LTNNPENREEDCDEKASTIGAGAYEYDGHAVDEFMWKGDPDATPVQRVGLVIFALLFLFLFALFVVLLVLAHDISAFVVGVPIGTLSGIFGFRFLYNAFRRKKHRRGIR